MTSVYANLWPTNSAVRQMTARFESRCTICSETIQPGDKINYNANLHRSSHTNCPDITGPLNLLLAAVRVGVLAEGEEFTRQLERVTEEVLARRLARKLPRAARSAAPVASAAVAPAPKIADGYYTVEFASGDYRTFRVRTQPADADFAPGQQIISYLSGSDNESSYTRFGFVRGATVAPWRRFAGDTVLVRAAKVLEDPEAAAKTGLAFALRSNRCYRCGHQLTVPASIHAGLGPDCAAKVGA